MAEHREIFDQYASQYERLVGREDYQNNILNAIGQVAAPGGKDVVELGAGTGRLTCMLAPLVRSIRAFDASQHMLEVAIARLQKSGLQNWRVEVGDHRAISAPDNAFDLAISGWSICYLVDWNEKSWKAEVEMALAEMRRLLRPGGTIVLLETQGTGYESPHPPEHLVEYFRFLDQQGFHSTWMRTDYRFASLEEGVELVKFFFGEPLAQRMQASGLLTLPECTGLWWLKV